MLPWKAAPVKPSPPELSIASIRIDSERRRAERGVAVDDGARPSGGGRGRQQMRGRPSGRRHERSDGADECCREEEENRRKDKGVINDKENKE